MGMKARPKLQLEHRLTREGWIGLHERSIKTILEASGIDEEELFPMRLMLFNPKTRVRRVRMTMTLTVEEIDA